MITVRRHTDVWLVRHTQTDRNAVRRYQSRSDRPLTAFGESTTDLWTRVECAWDDLLRRFDGQRILIVTHATPIQLLLCALLGVPFDRSWQFRIDLGGITNLDLYASGAITRVINEVPPLIAVHRHRNSSDENVEQVKC